MLLGDARKLTNYLSPLRGRFASVITSPPYADMQDYGVPRQIGYGQTLPVYLKDLRSVFEACAELSTDTATMWLVLGAIRRKGEVVLLPSRVAEQAQKAGWKVREVITWEKTKGLPFTKHGEFRDVTEQVILLSKSTGYRFETEFLQSPEPRSIWWRRYPERYSPEGRKPTNVWKVAIPTQGSWKPGPNHSCPFPHELTYRMLTVVTAEADLVLDPFAGVGSVPALANVMGRRGYGLDLSPRFVAEYQRTLASASSWWKAKKSHFALSADRRKVFRETILQLRLLKFGRLVSDRLSSDLHRPRWVRVVGYESGSLERYKITRGEFELIFDDDSCEQTVIRLAQEAAAKRPLSKFGIEAEFRVVKTCDARRDGRWYPSCKFWRPSTPVQPAEDGTSSLVANFEPAADMVASWQTVDGSRTE